MAILALDTSLDATSAAIGTDDGRLLSSRFEVGPARQAELLMPMVEAVLKEAALAPAALAKIGVTVGPGSFTGLRIALAASRAMAVALGIPVIGIATTEGIAAAAPPGRPVLVAIDARRGQLYLQYFDARGRARGAPFVADAHAPGDPPFGVREAAGVAGSGTDLACAALRAGGVEAVPLRVPPRPDAKLLLPLLAARAGRSGEAPAPLYLRAADAVPAANLGAAHAP